LFHQRPVDFHKSARGIPDFEAKTILVTGVGMTKGLALARLFYEAGHNVIGADFEPNGALVCGRVSKSITKFYPLQKPTPRGGSAPYIQGLLDIILKDRVDLWVSCSGVASAVEDGEAKEIVEARTKCRAIQFDVKTTQMLHEKHTFIEHTESIGLTIPETHTITSRAQLEEVLHHAPPDRKYIMKPIGVDDANRADMTLLPRPEQSETSKHVARLRISEDLPWICQQFIRGSEFCTHALVVKGKVKAFVACPSAELLMHYEALPAKTALSKAMLRFTQHYAAKGGDSFTGHLSFDFLVEDEAMTDPEKIVLYPIECNPRAHTAVALFEGTTSMVDAYLSLLQSSRVSNGASTIVTPLRNDKYYWIGHDFMVYFLLPLYKLLTLNSSIADFMKDLQFFITHFLFWKDGTFEIWDPLPWWWLYHIYWPMRFLTCIRTGQKWSRINVSTTKMFEC